MQVTENNLKIEREDFTIHSLPISFDIYKRYAGILAKTMSDLRSDVESMHEQQAVAYRYLLDAIQDKSKSKYDAQEFVRDVTNGLIGEMRRLTHVLRIKNTGGWEDVPLDVANLTEEQEWEVMNELVFFTLVCRMNPSIRAYPIHFLSNGKRLTSLSARDLMNSLQTAKSSTSTTATT